jgi:hypothetical protein
VNKEVEKALLYPNTTANKEVGKAFFIIKILLYPTPTANKEVGKFLLYPNTTVNK